MDTSTTDIVAGSYDTAARGVSIDGRHTADAVEKLW